VLRKLLISGLAIAVLMTGYVSWPVLEAYRLRQAVRAGDVAVLDAKVDWVAVRRSLKQSIAELSSGRGSASGSSIEPERSLLSSFKLAMAPTVAERFIDSYVSADGIGKIDWARQGLASARGTVARLGEGDVDGAWAAVSGGSQPGALARFLSFYDRIVRARFHSLGHVEFEIRDRNAPARRYISEFQLQERGWRLVSVRITGALF